MKYVVDTHSLVWFLTEDKRLSEKALQILDTKNPSDLIIVPTIVLAEILYINKKGKIKISFEDTVHSIANNSNFEIQVLDLPILFTASKITEHFETHDKIIIATAIYNDARIITKDSEIRNSKIVKIVW